MAKTVGSKSICALAGINWSKPIDVEDKYAMAFYRNSNTFPELMVLFNQITLVRNDDGLISATLTLQKMRDMVESAQLRFRDGTVVTTDIMGSILKLIKFKSRSELLVGTQVANTRWASNVPLFMSAFKEYRNVKYSEWDFSDPKLSVLIDAECLSMIECLGTIIEWKDDYLVELGEKMRTTGKGVMDGLTSFKANKTKDEEFDLLPNMVKRLITQVWAFAPSIASEYAIRNLADIDAPAVPLVGVTLFVKKPAQTETNEW